MIKHAFDSYPKVRIGKFTALETEEQAPEIDYGIEEAEAVEVKQQPVEAFGHDDSEKYPESTTVQFTPQPEDEDAGF
jgi:hypothetical protein